jgi:rRNA maturation protein Nop10
MLWCPECGGQMEWANDGSFQYCQKCGHQELSTCDHRWETRSEEQLGPSPMNDYTVWWEECTLCGAERNRNVTH